MKIMGTEKTTIHSIAIVVHPKIPNALQEAEQIVDFFNRHQVNATVAFLYNEDLHRRVRANEFQAIIALGGDGTMLRAGHLAGPVDLPIIGINLGHFGFLMEIRQQQWQEFLPKLLSGDYWIEKRLTLSVEQWRGGDKLGSWDVVLNEVAVSRGQMVRPIRIKTFVDGRHLTTYVADALLASTPTGSTAYALAAGGPILPPELRNILLVPVAPHLSLDRPIVLAEGAAVSITVQSDHQAVLSVDGQVPIGLSDDDRLEVRTGSHSVQFIRFQDPGYFYRNLTPHMNQNPSISSVR
jgi:NAD+ kinase